jgi:hypothetical protein
MSSNLSSVGYDGDKAILEIQFKNGRIYRYFNVPQNIYDSLMSAGSKGKYFHWHIRRSYRYSRVR